MNPRMTQESENIELKLKWTKTWEDREGDFHAHSPVFDQTVGRFYLNESGANKDSWTWSLTAAGEGVKRHDIGALNGVEPSARHAAKAIESSWFKAIAGGILDITDKAPTAAKNSYAAAKGRE